MSDGTPAAAGNAARGRSAAPNQFALLRQQRFLPFFLTQVLGAANDNLFKFALTVLVTYELQLAWLPAEQTGPLIGALFVLPLILVSSLCGQMVDKYDLARMTRALKGYELAVMLLAALGFLLWSVPLLLGCVFLMGIHSALASTLKFGYLPRHLVEGELTGGNGVMESGLFVAILLGNIAGGLLVGVDRHGTALVGITCLLLAVLGWRAARKVPQTPAAVPDLKVRWSPVSEAVANLRLAARRPTVFRSILGTSWLWFFGAMFLGNFPAFARQVLHGDEQVASMLLVIFLVGIGTGSLLCESLSRRHVELGLIPLGAIGMSVFSIDLFVATHALPDSPLMEMGPFLADRAHWRLMLDLFLLSMFCGLYSVPMYALIQLRSDPSHRARIVAANNILNGLFMTASSLVAGVAIHLGMTLPQLFILTGVANAVVAVYVFLLLPAYLLRFVSWLIAHILYRIRVKGDGNIPNHGAALMVSNRVSYVDALLIMAVSPRPVRFLIERHVFERRLIGPMLRMARAIPLQMQGDALHPSALAAVQEALQAREVVAVFPEGAMTHDGQLGPFRDSLLTLLRKDPQLPVIPVALVNLWGSFFSLADGAAMRRPFRRGLFTRVAVVVHEPVPAACCQPEQLHRLIDGMLREGAQDPVGG